MGIIRSFFQGIKWFIQRGKRGYADSDLWYLGWYISNLMVDALGQFKETQCGYPARFTEEKWKKLLDEMIEGFRFHRDVDDIEKKAFDKFGPERKDGKLLWLEHVEKQRKIAEKKLSTFIKYFEYLWD